MLVKSDEWQEAMKPIATHKGNRSTYRKELIAQGYVTKDWQDFVTLTAKGLKAVGHA